jgi:phosphoribosyl 1,2-cyclic phosphate phosphodiesterase
MRISFLGTGAAGGVPLYGCACSACQRGHLQAAHQRRPCSALVEDGETRLLLDAGLMDLHARFAPGTLSAILLTHFHPDHVQGLFHLRWGRGTPIPVYAPPDPEGCADLTKHPGLLDFQRLAEFEPLVIGSLTVTPLPMIHSKPTFGYAIENAQGARFAYLTDTAGLPPSTEKFLLAWSPTGLALDCSHPPRAQPGRNHNDWNQALHIVETLRPARTWLTHISHDLDRWQLETQPTLPESVSIAVDGEQAVLGLRSDWPIR